MTNITYSQAKSLIKEGDVLLFQGKGMLSWLIKRYGSGVHSHVGIAHWDGKHLQCVEFREFKGGRSISLKSQVDENLADIDVFRAAKTIEYDDIKYELTEVVTSKISSILILLTGLPYGWKNIWKLVKHYTPLLRLAPQNMKDDDPTKVFVCSTAVAYAYRMAYVDPVPYLADTAVAPADLARSALFKYQFTIEKD